jgi:hypothetical protein
VARFEVRPVDRGVFKPGKRVVNRIELATNGDSRVLVTREASGRTAFGRLFLGLMSLTREFFIRRSIQAGLDQIARLDA